MILSSAAGWIVNRPAFLKKCCQFCCHFTSTADRGVTSIPTKTLFLQLRFPFLILCFSLSTTTIITKDVITYVRTSTSTSTYLRTCRIYANRRERRRRKKRMYSFEISLVYCYVIVRTWDKLVCPTSDGRACIVTRFWEGVRGFESPPEQIGQPGYPNSHNNYFYYSCIIWYDQMIPGHRSYFWR